MQSIPARFEPFIIQRLQNRVKYAHSVRLLKEVDASFPERTVCIHENVENITPTDPQASRSNDRKRYRIQATQKTNTDKLGIPATKREKARTIDP